MEYGCPDWILIKCLKWIKANDQLKRKDNVSIYSINEQLSSLMELRVAKLAHHINYEKLSDKEFKALSED